MAKTISAGWRSYSVSRNSNWSYTVSSWWKSSTVSGNSSLWRSIWSAYSSSGGSSSGSSGSSGWNYSSSGWNYSSSSSNYSWWKNTVASSVNQPTVTKNINWTNFWFSKNADGSYNVYANGKYSTVQANSELGKAAAWYLWSSGSSSNSNSSNNNSNTSTSSTWTDKYTSNSFKNYSNAMNHYISQGMTQDQAHEKAKWFLEDNPNYISKSSEEKMAEQYSPTVDENEDEYNIWEQEDEWEEDYYENEYYNPNEDVLWDTINNLQDTINRLESRNTESQVIENKAETSKDPIFDYNTYFKENLAPDANVWETWEVKAETPTTNAPLTDVTKYQDEAISALENLWFLEPDTEAAESMPDTEEQTTPEAEAEAATDTPESLIQWFDDEMTSLENWLTDGRAINPKWLAQTYVDYKNRLAKYIKDNNISNEEAAAMFDSLRNNQTFRNLLNSYKK